MLTKELSELHKSLLYFVKEYNDKDRIKEREKCQVLMDRIEESLKQSFASLKRAQSMQQEYNKSTDYCQYKSICKDYSELNEKLIMKIILKIEFKMKSYLETKRKNSGLLKNILKISCEVDEQILSLKKKPLLKLFNGNALKDIKIIELLLLVDSYEYIKKQINEK